MGWMNLLSNRLAEVENERSAAQAARDQKEAQAQAMIIKMMEHGYTPQEGFYTPGAAGEKLPPISASVGAKGLLNRLMQGFQSPDVGTPSTIDYTAWGPGLKRRAEAAKYNAEADKFGADKDKIRAETEGLNIKNELDKTYGGRDRELDISEQEANIRSINKETEMLSAETKGVLIQNGIKELERQEKEYVFNELKKNRQYRDTFKKIDMEKAKITMIAERYQIIDTKEGLFVRDVSDGKLTQVTDRTASAEEARLQRQLVLAQIAATLSKVDTSIGPADDFVDANEKALVEKKDVGELLDEGLNGDGSGGPTVYDAYDTSEYDNMSGGQTIPKKINGLPWGL